MQPTPLLQRRTGMRVLLAGTACAVVAATLTGCTSSPLRSASPLRSSTDTTAATQAPETVLNRLVASDHGSLTPREFSVAVAIARHELSKNPPWSVSSVTATVSQGKVLHGNVGPHRHCLSGTLLHIKFIGKFPNIAHGGQPGLKYLPVSAVLEVADPASGDPCLVSVQTGHVTPSPGATALFAR